MLRKNLIISSKKLQRMKWGKSQEIAEKMKLNPNTLSRKIRGDLQITMLELNRLAKIFGVDTMELMHETYDDVEKRAADD